ncbi:MAG: hypothetical protein ACT4QG_17735 [Sporichthyaceae bacterium]
MPPPPVYGAPPPAYAPPAPGYDQPAGVPRWDLDDPDARAGSRPAALDLLQYWPVAVPGAIAVISGLWILWELVG